MMDWRKTLEVVCCCLCFCNHFITNPWCFFFQKLIENKHTFILASFLLSAIWPVSPKVKVIRWTSLGRWQRTPRAHLQMQRCCMPLTVWWCRTLISMAHGQGGRYGDMIMARKCGEWHHIIPLNIHEPITLGLMSLSPNICAIGVKTPIAFFVFVGINSSTFAVGVIRNLKNLSPPPRAETKKSCMCTISCR